MDSTRMNLRVVHVDDDPTALQRLKKLLEKEPNVEYLSGFSSADDAVRFLRSTKPDLTFMDVEMPEKNGLWLARELRAMQPEIAFVTSYAGYAAQAFDVCALDYLMKPMDEDKLHILLEKVRHKKAQGVMSMQEQVEAIYTYLNPELKPSRIFIDMVGKIQVVKLEEVLYLKSQSNYTLIVLNTGEHHIASKTIKTFEEALKNHPDFSRVSRSYIINKNYISSVQRIVTTRKMMLVMADGHHVDTSFKTKEELTERLSM